MKQNKNTYDKRLEDPEERKHDQRVYGKEVEDSEERKRI